MLTKTTFLALATSIALVRAQEFTDIDVHSTSNCNPDPNDLEADSMQLSFSPETDDQGNQFSGCMEATIGLPGWPVTDNGKYTAWVDTSKFGEGCSMLFFNLAGSQEEGDSEYPCRNGLYRKIQKDKTPCGDLDLTEKFGYAYCCGDLCNQDVTSWPGAKKRDVGTKSKAPALKDVTKIKRSPVFKAKRQQEGNSNCIINLKEEPYTTFGEQIQMGPEEFCQPEQTTCGQAWTYTAGTELTNTETHEDSTEIGWSEYITFVNTFSDGYEISKSESESRSYTKTIGPEPGHAGYPTFTPLYWCAEADLSGDCSRENLGISDGRICVQKYLPGDVPDGNWDMVITD